MDRSQPLKPMTVSELNRLAGELLSQGLSSVFVTGEIRDLVTAASGHTYFKLRDAASSVDCVLFARYARTAALALREGDEVEIEGAASLYAPRGVFQVIVRGVRAAGLGRLYESYLETKARLEAEGLFDRARKLAPPLYARTIGIVTSTKGAALQDALTTLAASAPYADVVVYPALVQGEGSAQSVVEALEKAFARRECDVLLVIRGGGSIADLWTFNEESVARALARRTIPVVTGIGHETDTTIADLVADVRALTPTAAALAASVSREAGLSRVRAADRSVLRETASGLASLSQRLDAAELAVRPAGRALQAQKARLEAGATQVGLGMRAILSAKVAGLATAQPAGPGALIELLGHRFARAQSAAREALSASLQAREARLAALQAGLQAMNPERLLQKGYALLEDETGAGVDAARRFEPGQGLIVRTASQRLDARVLAVRDRVLAPQASRARGTKKSPP